MLQKVDLDLLNSNEGKWAFFVNLHNLISLHGLVERLALSCGSHFSEKVVGVSNVLAFQLRNSYVVGQLGVCSIYELQQFVLRATCRQQQLGNVHIYSCFLLTLCGSSSLLYILSVSEQV